MHLLFVRKNPSVSDPDHPGTGGGDCIVMGNYNNRDSFFILLF